MLAFCTRLRSTVRRPRLALRWLVLPALLRLGISGGGWYGWTRHGEPRAHYRAARRALDRRDCEEARRHLAVCLRAWPDDAAIHFLAARAARRAGALDEAEEQLALCQHLQEKQPDPTLGDTALEWALLEAQRGNLVEVEEPLRARLREGHPDSLLILEVLSWELMWTYRLREARYCLDMWLERQPEDYDALVRRGWVAEHVMDFPAALRDYGRALEVDPKQDAVRLRVAELLLRGNRPAEALTHLRRLQERQPGNPAVLVALGRCQRLLGQFPEATRLLDAVLAAHPDDARALSERGLLALEAGEAGEAERLLRRAAEREPCNRQVNYNLYRCLDRFGKKAEAQQVLARLGRADADLKRMGQFMQDVMKTPHNAALRYEVGMLFLRNGFSEDGLRWLGTALKEDPLHRLCHEALAQYYEHAGERELAARHREFLQRSEGKEPAAAGGGRSFAPGP